jgi:hypothetical protein
MSGQTGSSDILDPTVFSRLRACVELSDRDGEIPLLVL